MRPRRPQTTTTTMGALTLLFLVLLTGPAMLASAFQETDCVMRPDNDEDNVIEDSKSVTLECSFDSRVESCTWTHNEPMNERRGSSDIEPDFRCTGTPEQTSGDRYCTDDNSVSVLFSETSCGINIGNAKPEHTGRWEMSALGFSQSGSQAQVADYLFTLYTFNQSTVYLVDNEDHDVDNDNIDTTYNYNDRSDDWEDEKSGWESLEFIARAYGGRPEPTFLWYIDNRGNDLDMDESGVFRVSEGVIGCEDDLGYICNRQSSITFGVDDRLMEVLDGFGVDTNPEDETVRFELACDIEQYGTSFVQTVRVDVNVEKSYDNGALPASTIGIICAVVIAVVILLIVVCCLLMAKRSGRWCFAEDEEGGDGRRKNKYGYKRAGTKDPRDPRSGGGGYPTKSSAPQGRNAPAGGARRDPYRSSGSSGDRRHHSSQQVHSTTIVNSAAGAGAASNAAPLLGKRRPESSTSSSSSSSSPDAKKNQNWTLPPKELRESLNKLNEERKYQSSSSSDLPSTPDTPRKKRRPVPAPLDLPKTEDERHLADRREPLFVKNRDRPSTAATTPTSLSSSSNNTSHNATGATPKVHRGVWQAAPPYPNYQTTDSTTSSTSAGTASTGDTPFKRPREGESPPPPPLLPRQKSGNNNRSASVSNRESSLNYADLDLQQSQQDNRRSFMQDPRNQVLPAFTVVPRQSPPSDMEAAKRAATTTTVTTEERRSEYASVVATSSYV